MIDIKKTAIITMCSIACISCIPVYADTTGTIKVSANIKAEDFRGEIYIIVSDESGNLRLTILNSKNNFEFTLSNLQYGHYEIKEVHVYNTDDESSNDRREINKEDIDFTLMNDSLDISESNLETSIFLDLNSIKKDEINESNSISTGDEDENGNVEGKDNEDSKSNDSSQEDEIKMEKIRKSTERRKKIYFFNFVLDAVLILGLGSIWFFKIREKKNKH